ncbi:MAG: glycosyltransferase [Candidatus Zixiibacteriota bacterium]
MRIIVVSYYFPPLGLAGTARPLALANFFAARGDEVFVVTVKPISYPALDKSMEEQIDRRVTVVRVGSTDPARVSRFLPILWLKKILGKSAQKSVASTLFPDSKFGFVPGAVRAVKKLLVHDGATVVITTSPPVSAHIVGIEAARQPHVKWIADWRDIWSSLPFVDDGGERMAKAEALQKAIVESASLVTATSPKTAAALAQKYQIETKTMFIPNGFSEDDFREQIRPEPVTIGVYGTLNHLVGFEQVADWLGEYGRSNGAREFQLRHVGHLDLPELEKVLTRNSLSEKFSSTGYMPHQQSLNLIRSSAVNLIALSGEHDTSYVVPSKLWELLRAEAPLIAILPKGNAAREILEERKFPGVWIVDTAAEFAAALVETIDVNSKCRGLRGAGDFSEFEWKAQFARLAQRIDGLTK